MVVRDIVGVQAQVFSAALLALRARVGRLAPGDVDRALWEDRDLVKTWSMRGALHLVPGRDYGRYAAALRPVARRERQWIARYLAPEEPDRVVDVIRKTLASGPMTRKELTERIVAAAGPNLRKWIASGWGGLPKLASLQGHLCQGPGEGQEVTFVRTEDWLPDQEVVSLEDAEDELLRRYLSAFGPATIRDYSMWSGIPVRDARSAWARCADECVEVKVDGATSFALRADARELSGDPNGEGVVRLLPSFDSFLLGHVDKSHLIDDKHYKRVYRKAGWLTPVVLVDGRIAGTWGHAKKGKGWRISVEMFGRASRAVRDGIGREAEDVGRFLGGDAEIAYA